MAERTSIRLRWPICNDCPDRAPRIGGHAFILCWRCTAVILGALPVAAHIAAPSNTVLALALLLPLIVDGTLQALAVAQSTNPRRLLTGLLAGWGAISLLVFFVPPG